MADGVPVSVAPARTAWRDRRFLVLLALGFSAGVPLPLSGFVLRRWLAESAIPIELVGATAALGLAYSLKFLWAPVLDHVPPPAFRALGRRRGWLASIHPLLALAVLLLGFTAPTATDVTLTFAIAALVAFLSASQDVVIDAYRIDVLEEREQGYGLALYVWGYRAALLASNAGVLAIAQFFGWPVAFCYSAGLVGIGFVAVLLAPEPTAQVVAPADWRSRIRVAVVDPFLDFVRRPHWLAILLFIVLFKLGEALAGVMTPSFYTELGFTGVELAAVGNVFGLAAILFGALSGGWLIAQIGIARALVATGLGQMLSNLMYVALARTGHSMPMLWAQVGIENFTDGLADAAFLAYLSSLTNRAFSATQYALLSSLAVFATRTLGAFSGYPARWLGWPDFFLLTTAAALPAMGIMLYLLRALPAEGRG
ncbi:AmpG family muropeptide MFS transporter [Paracraurococcus lichenis]|uniref:MFS transporter n=1 Tax=Paracraurococcus lichenis TaxID=3064888 RepID=A0ABT9DXV4_9PROT|nr:MFS transporter [Paracraurococcus sp. LOR1-02]MDO9708732.1 MFS transporter [Paracraurococcus sp. LOR1-02]